jgi:16S rRNA (guanine966-N2)-methyltransferase
VRESLFGWLGDVTGARTLDLYAGSGALGIEALSRGAAGAVFVECAAVAVACIHANLEHLRLEGVGRVLRLRVERARSALLRAGPFDLVLCDPPWAELGSALHAVGRLVGPDLLAAGAAVVIEHPARSPLAEVPGADLLLEQRRSWGDSAAAVFRDPRLPAGRSREGSPAGRRGV